MSKREELLALREKMLKDDSLPLKEGANRLVFGQGDPEAAILLIGEGPGYWEDQKGLPFVGNAGGLLNHLLTAIGLERKKNVFITNVVHHRPPNNRDPEPAELKEYGKYLDGIIDIIEPEVIVTLGRFSMAKFIPGVLISHVHGKSHKVKWKEREILVCPMYHPAAALRNGEIKKRLFEDFTKIPEEMKKMVKEREEKVSEKEQMNLL